jgi:hypothetical protein
MRIGERGDRQLDRIIHPWAPCLSRSPRLPAGQFGRPEERGVQRAVAAGHEPEARADAELPSDLLHAGSPVGECMAATTGERPNEILPALPPRECGPNFPFERSAAERGIPAPTANRDYDVGIHERPGEMERLASLVRHEIRRGRVIPGIKHGRVTNACTGRQLAARPQRLERLGEQSLDVAHLHASAGEP